MWHISRHVERSLNSIVVDQNPALNTPTLMRDDFEAEIMMMTIMIYGFSTLAKTQLMPHNIQLSQSDMQYITTAECPRRKTGIAL